MTGKPLAVLVIEDSESDAELIVRLLQKAGYEVASERAETAAQLSAAMTHRTWDIVISDYRMPQLNAEHALKMVQDADPDLPFLVVSGSIGENFAVAMMRAGAQDYLMKENLSRLPPAIDRELGQAAIRRERRQAEEKLRESEKRYRLLAENVLDVIWILDLETSRYRYVSPSVERLRGFTAEEVMAQDLSASLTVESARTLNEVLPGRIQNFRQGIHNSNFDEMEQPCRDGTTVWTEVTTFYRINEVNGHLEIYGVSRNITERKRARDALRASEERFSTIFNTSPIGIVISRMTDGKVIDVNPIVTELLGYRREELINHSTVELNVWEDIDTRNEMLRRLRENGHVHDFETKYRRKTGETGELLVSAELIRLNDEPFMLSLLQDITARKRADDTLRTSEERYRMLAENMSDTVWLMDMNLSILYISPSVTRQRGYTLEELNAVPLERQLTPESLKRALQLLAETIAPENLNRPDPILSRTVELEFIRKDGTTLWTDNLFTVILAPDGRPANILGAARDITERKRAEELTRRQLEQLAALRKIDNAIRGSLDLRLTLSIVLRETIAQLSVDAARILLLHPHAKILEYAAGTGFRTNALQHAEIRLGQGFAGQAALEQRTIHIPDLRVRKTDFLNLENFAAEHFITYCAVPLITKGKVIGVLEVFHRSFSPLEERMADWQDFLETIADQAAIAVENMQLFTGMQQSNLELTHAYDDILESWAHVLDIREKESPGHASRVTEETIRLAKALGMNDVETADLRRGALLHDVGKMAVPDAILFKSGGLSPDEEKILNRHPVYAYEMLSTVASLRAALDIPYCHHEKWDGSGYPRGLRGDQIPLSARIFAVVDTWDTLINEGPNRPPRSREQALESLRSQSEADFDPQVVDAFLRVMETEKLV